MKDRRSWLFFPSKLKEGNAAAWYRMCWVHKMFAVLVTSLGRARISFPCNFRASKTWRRQSEMMMRRTSPDTGSAVQVWWLVAMSTPLLLFTFAVAIHAAKSGTLWRFDEEANLNEPAFHNSVFDLATKRRWFRASRPSSVSILVLCPLFSLPPPRRLCFH